MDDVLLTGLQFALATLVFCLLPIAYRIAAGPSPVERLQAIDALAVLLVAILIVLALLQGTGLFIDVALALAAFSFIATLGIARFLAEGKVF